MIKIQGIDHVAFNVRDLNKSLEFYTKTIGLKVTEREPSKPGIEYFLDCGSSLLGIIQAQDLKSSHLFANEGLGANHFSFRVNARDFEAMIAHLEAHDVKIEFAKKRPKSWSLYFYDPDGNKLEATAWPVEDGVAENQRVKAIYDGKSKSWKAY
ncbi:MAG: VOC family protein [Candidatus Omnitrophica bacterium]|nr:VOC family protein [Candidatus Omnitrophota bacterium]MDE2009371.1 VOC family protein [Candidatus Omnitrophota bacterium]MDE2214155.1 VOC family protein [Candidatus Omnitrophota bacterium]MDE2231192.1 VOC family protein [Candidatus Omnitrophota bacterium]